MTDQPVLFSVLVVDDEPANIDILKDILQPFYKVRGCPVRANRTESHTANTAGSDIAGCDDA